MVFTLFAQLAQLHVMDFASDDGSQFLDLGLALGKQVAEGRVCVLSVVIVLKGL